MKLRNFFLSACSALAVFAACEQMEENLGTPDISISTSEMTFESAADEQELTVTATRDWKVETDADWVVVSPESGSGSAEPQKVTVTVLANPGMDRTVDIKFTIGMKSKYLTVSQAGPGGSPEALILYYNDFDKEEAAKTYGTSGSSWPYLDQFEGWKNATGSGAANVSYSYKGMSARANSTSNSNYADYAGSGKNNMFFGSSAYLSTNNIALNGATGLTLTFGTEKYSQDNGSVFTNSEYKIYLSNDGAKWVELTDYTFAGGTTEGRWNLATANFSVPAGTETLSICMQVTVASSYRMDDMKLVISEGGTAVDFSKGVAMDFGAGESGGNTGGDTPSTPSDANAIYSNNFDKTISSKNSSNQWPYCDEFDGWKNEAGSGAANITYTFKSASARATSSNNNIWMPKTGSYFSIQNIALNSTTSLELTFNVICGSPGSYKKTFNASVFKVYLSNDNSKWVEMPVTVTANGTEFDSAVATFSVPANTATLSIAFEKISDESDGYRIDNVNLAASANAGTAVDFTSGTEIDFSEGGTGGGNTGDNTGGNTGGDSTGAPATLVEATVAEFLAAAEDDTWYKLTGEIISIAKETYGNFTIKDSTGEVYIYGMTNVWVGSNDQSFSKIGLKVGDIVTLGTLRTSYNSTPQGGGSKIPAYYISHVAGSGSDSGDEGGQDPVTPPAVAANGADLETLTLSSNYIDATTAAGWKLTTCAIVTYGTANSNTSFSCIDEGKTAAVMNGRKDKAIGSIESPVISGGCGVLAFDYAYLFSESKGISFKVEVIQNDAVVKTITVTKSDAVKLQKYSHSESVNVDGEFKLKFTNLSPTNNSSANKDRFAVWNIAWDNYAE